MSRCSVNTTSFRRGDDCGGGILPAPYGTDSSATRLAMAAGVKISRASLPVPRTCDLRHYGARHRQGFEIGRGSQSRQRARRGCGGGCLVEDLFFSGFHLMAGASSRSSSSSASSMGAEWRSTSGNRSALEQFSSWSRCSNRSRRRLSDW